MIKGMVSVVIPTYHGANCIADTLVGVMKQTYPSIEVIVVDDNGNGTEEQLATQAAVKHFPEVRYLSHDVNRNGSAARNTGIRAAQGEYIAFLDDDDVWDCRKIEKQVQRFEELPKEYGLVYGPFLSVQSDESSQIIEMPADGSILFEFLIGRVRIGSSLMMIRRSIIDQVGVFDETFRRHQDWEYITRIAADYKISYVPDAWTIKYEKERNKPKDLEKIIQYRLYFLEKMTPYIDCLEADKKQQVYEYQFSFLAKECLRRLKIKQCIHWLKRTGRPWQYGFSILADAVKKCCRSTRTLNGEEAIKRAGIQLEKKDNCYEYTGIDPAVPYRG